MAKRRLRTPAYRIVEVRRDRLGWMKMGFLWSFRLLLLGLMLLVLIYNQYALSSAVKTVEELKRSLLLKETEYPIKKMLDERSQGRLNELERIRIAKLIEAAQGSGVDPVFAIDLIGRESGFEPSAVSHKGAVGLMQLMPATAQWLAERHGVSWPGREALFEPATNVKFGMAYLAYLAPEFRGEARLRAAYQRGPARVRQREEGEP